MQAKTIAQALEITKEMNILDVGAGTGALSIELSNYCQEITAVDVSNQMLQILETKANKKTC